MARARTIEAFTQDVRYGVRQLRRNAGWTAVATITLALGIGATTAVFSVINSLILNPLPYRDADRVANVMMADTKSRISVSPDANLVRAWRQGARTLEDIEEFATRQATVVAQGTPARMDMAFASPSLLRFAGMPLLRGRFFTAADADKGAPRTAILTEQTWRTKFGSDPAAIGSTIRVDDVVHTIIGVTPSRLRFPITFGEPFEILVPLDTSDNFLPRSTMVRLKPGVTVAQASAEMNVIAARVPTRRVNSSMTTALRSASDMIWFKKQIYVVAAAVGLLLLIACANVAHLLLARGAARERELSIRTAIGAGTGRLVRQLLTESTMLALIGCAAGVALGTLGIRALIAFRPERMGQLGNTFIDWRVVVVAAGVSLFTGLAFGLTGAVHSLRQRRTGLLGSASRPGNAPARQRLRSTLVVTEMALSTVLLVGALLLVHSIIKLQRVDPGFDARDLYAMEIELPRSRYDETRTDNFALELRSRLERSTGVAGVAIASAAPPSFGFMSGTLAIEGRPVAENAPPFNAVNWADPNYFSLVGLPIVAGRRFSTGKAADDEVIINIGAAKKLWGNESPVGKRIKFLSPAMPADSISWGRIVGVVADAASGSLTADRSDLLVYYPRSSIRGMSDFTTIIRGQRGSNPAEVARRAVAQMDPLLAPPRIISVQQSLFDTFAQTRFTMLLMTVFAGIAVVLSAIGLYGVIAYAVAQRTREIGIRIALGATRRDIARRIAGQGLSLAGLGLVIGLVGGVFAARLIAAMLFGVTARDPLVLASTAGVLAGVALLATLIPMRRATQVDPAIAMRAE
jgi:putative ABC transport system permease protein